MAGQKRLRGTRYSLAKTRCGHLSLRSEQTNIDSLLASFRVFARYLKLALRCSEHMNMPASSLNFNTLLLLLKDRNNIMGRIVSTLLK